MKGLFIGLTTVDLLYTLDGFPRENEKYKAQQAMLEIGGPATNAAFAFSALGGEAVLISPVGQHAWSEFIRKKILDLGITHVDLVHEEEYQSTISSIIINLQTGSRTVLTSTAEMLKSPIIPDLPIDEFDVFCIDGFYIEVAATILDGLAEQKPVVFDGGSYKSSTALCLKISNFPVFSHHFIPPNHKSLQEYLVSKSMTTYACTHGENPVTGRFKGEEFSLEVPQVKAVDTLAAGDIYHGALSYYLVYHQGDFRAALWDAARVASASCSYVGPRAWLSHWRG